MRARLVFLISAITVLAGAGSRARAADHPFSVQVTPSYWSGDYGTGTGTDLSYLPLELRWDLARARLKVLVPYVSISSSGSVTFTGSGPVAIGRSTQGGAPPQGGGTPTGQGAPQFVGSNNVATRQSGLGDIRLACDLYLVKGSDTRTWVSLTPFAKLPTADETKGLGTGEPDYGLGLGFIVPFSKRWKGYLDASYQVTGDPPDVDYRDVRKLGAGAGWAATDRLSWEAYVEDRTSILPGEADLLDLMAGARFHTEGSNGVGLYVFKGLSRTAEDWGLAVSLTI
jgi:outer membrane putative beta-barrel porin/alpha-amylase